MSRFAILLAAAVSLSAQIKFTRIENEHFALYSDGSPGRAAAVLDRLEKVRSFFLQTVNPRVVAAKPRIVLLNNPKTFATFVDRKTVAAYYIGLPHRDLIVVGPGANDMVVLTHEYVHMLVHQAGMRLPLWLNEGLAEVYSTVEYVDGRMRVGAPKVGYLQLLHRKFPDIRSILQAEDYGSTEHVGPLYAASWAIAHMMMLEDDLRPKFTRFTNALQAGLAPDLALRKSYGLTPQQLGEHVQGYIRGKTVNVVMFPFRWENQAGESKAAPATDLETGLTMVDLYLSGRDIVSAARAAEQATERYPDSAAAWESLAAVRMYQKDETGGAGALRQAFLSGSRNPDLLAIASSLHGKDRQLARQMIDRALEADPGHFEAQKQLAAWHMDGEDWSAALAALRGIKSLTYLEMRRYTPLFLQAAVRAGKPELAHGALLEFRENAITDEDKTLADRMGRMLTHGEAPPPPATGGIGSVVGQLAEVDCAGNRQVLHVATAEGLQKIPVDHTRTLLIGGDAPNIGCGPQKRKRRVRVGVSAEGVARKLEFLP